MSETEQHIGTLKRIPQGTHESMESLCEELCKQHGFEKATYHSSFKEVVQDSGYKQLIVVGNDVYEVVDKKELEGYDDIFHAEQNADGTISFVVKYYNGGCSFSEAIETALENMNEQEAAA